MVSRLGRRWGGGKEDGRVEYYGKTLLKSDMTQVEKIADFHFLQKGP